MKLSVGVTVVWTGASGTRPAPLQWTAEDCRERWRRGIPLAAEAPPLLEATAIEPLAEPTLEALAVAGADPAALQRFAEAWDRGDVGPDALFPERGRLGAPSVLERTGLGPEAIGFYTRGKVVTSRWPDPATSKIDLGFPQTR